MCGLPDMTGPVVHLLERSTNAADVLADVITANLVELPFRQTRYQIAETTGACEMLRQSIDALRRVIKQLEAILGMIDDRETREEFRRHLSSINETLVLVTAQLSNIDRMLQVALRRTHRQRR
jgi:flagellar biosynthesis/type III secretory pathway chaperone